MQKKFFLFGFSLLISSTLFAQKERVRYLQTFDEKPFHYGFYLGFNQNDFKINLNQNLINANITATANVGFNIGLIADFRINNNLNLRVEPGLISNTRTLNFTHLNKIQDNSREVGSTYLHVPLVLKFSTNRIGNIRPYLLAGISYDYNISSSEKDSDDNAAGVFRMNTSNFMYEVGVGVDFYMYFFKFSPSIRGVFALNNEVKYDNDPNSQWTAPLNFLGTRGIFVNFAFE